MTQTASGVTSFASEGDPRPLTQYRLSELLAQISDGQLEALGRLYDLTVPLVFQLSAAILDRDLVAAELVTQRVYAELWQRAKGYDSSRQSPLTFVMSLARTVAETSTAEASTAEPTAAKAVAAEGTAGEGTATGTDDLEAAG
ncbi:MAG: hypothetical protein ACR2P2_01265 [Nakamurella sp.]